MKYKVLHLSINLSPWEWTSCPNYVPYFQNWSYLILWNHWAIPYFVKNVSPCAACNLRTSCAQCIKFELTSNFFKYFEEPYFSYKHNIIFIPPWGLKSIEKLNEVGMKITSRHFLYRPRTSVLRLRRQAWISNVQKICVTQRTTCPGQFFTHVARFFTEYFRMLLLIWSRTATFISDST